MLPKSHTLNAVTHVNQLVIPCCYELRAKLSDTALNHTHFFV